MVYKYAPLYVLVDSVCASQAGNQYYLYWSLLKACLSLFNYIFNLLFILLQLRKHITHNSNKNIYKPV